VDVDREITVSDIAPIIPKGGPAKQQKKKRRKLSKSLKIVVPKNASESWKKLTRLAVGTSQYVEVKGRKYRVVKNPKTGALGYWVKARGRTFFVPVEKSPRARTQNLVNALALLGVAATGVAVFYYSPLRTLPQNYLGAQRHLKRMRQKGITLSVMEEALSTKRYRAQMFRFRQEGGWSNWTFRFFTKEDKIAGKLQFSLKGDSMYVDKVIFTKSGTRGTTLSEPYEGVFRDTAKGLATVAQKYGVKDVTIGANMEVGAYAWGRLGFDFGDNKWKSLTLDHFARNLRNQSRVYSEDLLDQEYGKILRFKHTWQFANYRGPKGERWGKEWLTSGGISWLGYLDLDPNSPGYKIFEKAMRLT
jgi:hypothetical protein